MYYTIGEVADLFGVNTSLIRFWEKEFDVIQPHRNKKGNRLFTPADIENFHMIYNMVKERGYTLQGAKDKLKQKPAEALHEFELISSLKKVKEFLLDINTELQSMSKTAE